MRKIFTWIGHPRENSLSHRMADSYINGAMQGEAKTRQQYLHDMDFDPDLQEGYHSRKTLEDCLNQWRENILWADHICWIFPLWWGGVPAKMKGVIDRAFLPGFAMQYHEDGPWWDKLLKGRSADVLITSDSPAWFDQIIYGRPAKKQVVNSILKFSGVKPVKAMQFGSVKTATPAKIDRWCNLSYKYGYKAAKYNGKAVS